MDRIGSGTGEPCEIINAQMGPLGLTTGFMNPLHREAVLEHFFTMHA